MTRYNDDHKFEEEINNAYISDIPSDPESTIQDYLTDTDETIAQAKNTIIISESDDSEDDVPLLILREKLNHPGLLSFQPPKWGKSEKPVPPLPFASESGVPEFIKNMENLTPCKLFGQFFTDDLIAHIVFQTNLYNKGKYQLINLIRGLTKMKLELFSELIY